MGALARTLARVVVDHMGGEPIGTGNAPRSIPSALADCSLSPLRWPQPKWR